MALISAITRPPKRRHCDDFSCPPAAPETLACPWYSRLRRSQEDDIMQTDDYLQMDRCSQRGAAVLDCEPLSDGYGAQIGGLDFTGTVSEPVRKALRQVLMDYQVLLFRRQFLDEDQQIRFAELFGSCRTMWQNPNYAAVNPKVHYLSNVDRNGVASGSHPDPGSTFWHSDGSWSRHPPRATVLNALSVPETNGDTQFVNLYQVYEGLDQTSKARFAGLQAEHHLELSRAARYRRLPWQWWRPGPGRESLPAQLRWWRRVLRQRRREGPVYHPLIRPHPDTGHLTLFIGDHAWRIARTPWPRGIGLMQQINTMEFRPETVYTHKWQAGDLLIWDNSSLLHRVLPYDLEEHVRIMRRCVVLR